MKVFIGIKLPYKDSTKNINERMFVSESIMFVGVCHVVVLYNICICNILAIIIYIYLMVNAALPHTALLLILNSTLFFLGTELNTIYTYTLA